MKRLIDVVLSFVALICVSPLLLVAGVVVTSSSPGPFLFRQLRVGRFGQEFEILKIRSMVAQSPETESSVEITASGDPRITPVGRILRNTKIDELPQLFNVLRGDMSIVGPRPEVSRYVRLWGDSERECILSVRPGITDPASIKLRRESEILALQPDPESYYVSHLLPQKAVIYVAYVKNQTLRGDLRIMMQTLRTVVRG